MGTVLVVQWLRLCVPNAGGPGLIPGWGTRSHYAATMTWCSQTNKYIILKIEELMYVEASDLPLPQI